MFRMRKYIFSLLALSILVAIALSVPEKSYAETAPAGSVTVIDRWQMLWENPGEELTIEEVIAVQDGWVDISTDGPNFTAPEGSRSAWVKLQVPELHQQRPAVLFENLYAQDIIIFSGNEVIYSINRGFKFNRNEFVLPLSSAEASEQLLIYLSSDSGLVGLRQSAIAGEYFDLRKIMMKSALLDITLGSSLIFIAFFMLICVLFLNRSFLPGWTSLFVVMLTIGIMVFTYSSFINGLFPEYGVVTYLLFDVASSLLVPALFFFFEKIFGRGPFGLVYKFRIIQVYMISISYVLLLASLFSATVESLYLVVGFSIFAVSIVFGNLLLLVTLVIQCLRGNRDAFIFAAGLGIFAIGGLIEISWYLFVDRMHVMSYWKLGILFFLASLIILVVQRVMKNYRQAIEYSRKLELFNNELQRSEKMDMISHLAASIAHEVRNPLQVTRGFMQLIGERVEDSRSKNYMHLAIKELDRASEIITDFLTFAKPDLGEMQEMDVAAEIQQIEAILAPLATMQGGVIRISTEPGLFAVGNSSKFKQALMNIIKNSIEAFVENGVVLINTYVGHNNNEIVIMIVDNGEGIDERDLERLGEPYYTKKSKGTGLGLMVTYRIIEAMQGKITFSSVKGEGTQVCIELPRYVKENR